MRNPALDTLLRAAAQDPKIVSFSGTSPSSEAFPKASLERATSQALLELQHAPKQEEAEGREDLRAHLAARLRARGADVEASDVLITNGSHDALELVMQLLKARSIQVDTETSPGALDVFGRYHCQPIVASAQVVRYAMPSMHTPRGTVATQEQRDAMLESKYVIEDDAYADLTFGGPASKPLLAESRVGVFHIGTFAKTVSPGLRLGWLVTPRAWFAAARELLVSRAIRTSALGQLVMARLLGTPQYENRLMTLRTHYAHRAAQLIRFLPAMRNVHFTLPAGGFTLWVETECFGSDEALLRSALGHGVSFDPGALFRAGPPSERQPLAMRLSFSSLELERAGEGVQRLAAVLDRVTPRRHLHRAA